MAKHKGPKIYPKGGKPSTGKQPGIPAESYTMKDGNDKKIPKPSKGKHKGAKHY